MESTHTFLDNLLVRYSWISNINYSPEFTTLIATNMVPTHFQAGQLHASIQRALSPICHLPGEVLAEILHSTRECHRSKGYYVSGFDVFNLSDRPWYLGQVCSAWRVAVETFCPDLWNMVALLERALERSRSCHLDFVFRYTGYNEISATYSEAEEDVMKQCFDLLLTHSTHWRSVELFIPPFLLTRISHIRGRVDNLHDMYLTCEEMAEPENINTFEIAPELKTLHLTDMHPEAFIMFPRGNLIVFLDARPLSSMERTPEYLDIIASCPNLLSFSYHHHSMIPESVGSQFPTTTHMSLQSLSTSLGKFLSSLNLPALKCMTVTSGCDIADNPAYDNISCPKDALLGLHALIIRSSCSLTALHLIDVPIMDDQLLSIIWLTPQLIAFTIELQASTLTSSTRNSDNLKHLCC
ncbi:hypothetical protein EDD85DRAFT_853167 [Armillaria nabsnona]|nr:hypothetical protein EDD85DRAFT_853167 [Armillaria nabsnona]